MGSWQTSKVKKLSKFVKIIVFFFKKKEENLVTFNQKEN